MEFGNYSLYTKTEHDSFYRNYYEPIGIEQAESDYYVIISEEYNLKPGKMALALYGSAQLGWVFTYFNRNQISNPIFDFTTGKIIRVPTKERLLSYF